MERLLDLTSRADLKSTHNAAKRLVRSRSTIGANALATALAATTMKSHASVAVRRIVARPVSGRRMVVAIVYTHGRPHSDAKFSNRT